MNTARNLVKNVAFVSGQRVFMQVIGVFVLGYLASILGVEQYGMFIFSLSFVSLFSLVSNLGTRTYATREIATNKENAVQIFSDIFPLRIVLTLCASLCAIIAVRLLPYSEKEVLLVDIAIFSQCCVWIYTNTFMAYEAFEKMAFPVTIDIVFRIFVLIASLIVVSAGYGVVGLAVCYAVGNLFEVFVAYHFMHKKLFTPTYKRMDLKLKRNVDLLKRSFPFCLLTIFSILLIESDKIMLSLMQSTTAVGLYGVAFTLSSRLGGMVDALATAFFPVIMRLKKDASPVYFRQKVTESMEGILVITIPMAVGVIALSSEIVALIYRNSEFLPSAITLQVLIVVLPLGSASFMFTYSLVGEGRHRVLVWVNGVVLIANLLLNLVLIPKYSYNGAAVASVFCVGMKTIFLAFICQSIVHWGSFLKTVLYSLGMAVAMLVLVNTLKDYNLFLAIGAGTVFYLLLVVLLKVVDVRRYLSLVRPGR